MKMGSLDKALAALLGMKLKASGLHRQEQDLYIKAVNAIAGRMRANLTHLWRAKGEGGSQMTYMVAVLTGKD